MKALISPQENNRIAQVEAVPFEVAKPLYWINCPDSVTTEWTYNGKEFVSPSIPTEEQA
jgi:hypothetical protein